jgi:hypothetical protein
LILTSLAMMAAAPAWAGEKPSATIYKNPQCSCCEGHAKHLRENGYEVRVVPTHNLPLIHRGHGIPRELAGCHTTIIGDYVVEGHVPASVIDRLLRERPQIKGISLPGMPDGSPGMAGEKREPFTIYELGSKEPKVYAVE